MPFSLNNALFQGAPKQAEHQENGCCVQEEGLQSRHAQPYLEEEAEADPLVVLYVSPLLGIDGLVHTRVGHVDAYPLPEGTGYGVGGVDPAVRVEHVLWDLLGVDAVDGIAHVLTGGDNQGEGNQEADCHRVVHPEDRRVYRDMADLDEALEASEHIQHLGFPLLLLLAVQGYQNCAVVATGAGFQL